MLEIFKYYTDSGLDFIEYDVLKKCLDDLNTKIENAKTICVSLYGKLYDNTEYIDRCKKLLNDMYPNCAITFMNDDIKGDKYRKTRHHKEKIEDDFYIFYDKMIDSCNVIKKADVLVIGYDFRKNAFASDGWGRYDDVGTDIQRCCADSNDIPVLLLEKPGEDRLPTIIEHGLKQIVDACKDRDTFAKSYYNRVHSVSWHYKKIFYCDNCFETIISNYFDKAQHTECCKSEIIPFEPWDDTYRITNCQIKKLKELGLDSNKIDDIQTSNDAVKLICSYISSTTLRTGYVYREIRSLISYMMGINTYPINFKKIDIGELEQISPKDLNNYLERLKNSMKKLKFRFMVHAAKYNDIKKMFLRYDFEKTDTNKYESKYFGYNSQNKLETITLRQDERYVIIEYHGYRRSELIEYIKKFSIKDVVYEDDNDTKKSIYTEVAKRVIDIFKNMNVKRVLTEQDMCDHRIKDFFEHNDDIDDVFGYILGYNIPEKIEYVKIQEIIGLCQYFNRYGNEDVENMLFKLQNKLRDTCTWKTGESHNIYNVNIRFGVPLFMTEIGELIITGASVIRRQAEYLKTLPKRELDNILSKSVILHEKKNYKILSIPYVKNVLKQDTEYEIEGLDIKYEPIQKKIIIEFLARCEGDIDTGTYTRYVNESEKDRYIKLKNDINNGIKYALYLKDNEIKIVEMKIYYVNETGLGRYEDDNYREISIEDAMHILRKNFNVEYVCEDNGITYNMIYIYNEAYEDIPGLYIPRLIYDNLIKTMTHTSLLDEDGNMIKCPNCGSDSCSYNTGSMYMWDDWYECDDCHEKWEKMITCYFCGKRVAITDPHTGYYMKDEDDITRDSCLQCNGIDPSDEQIKQMQEEYDSLSENDKTLFISKEKESIHHITDIGVPFEFSQDEYDIDLAEAKEYIQQGIYMLNDDLPAECTHDGIEGILIGINNNSPDPNDQDLPGIFIPKSRLHEFSEFTEISKVMDLYKKFLMGE